MCKFREHYVIMVDYSCRGMWDGNVTNGCHIWYHLQVSRDAHKIF